MKQHCIDKCIHTGYSTKLEAIAEKNVGTALYMVLQLSSLSGMKINK